MSDLIFLYVPVIIIAGFVMPSMLAKKMQLTYLSFAAYYIVVFASFYHNSGELSGSFLKAVFSSVCVLVLVKLVLYIRAFFEKKKATDE